MKTLFDLLSNYTLSPYMDKANSLCKLNLKWSAINARWGYDCTIANFDKGILTLSASNASWATRIRYTLPQIKEVLLNDQDFKSLKKIRCKVLGESNFVRKEEAKVKPSLSPLAAPSLIQAANNVKNHNLETALRKLANTILRRINGSKQG